MGRSEMDMEEGEEMNELKQWIDDTFWKRTWFRIGFVLFPSWIFILLFLKVKLDRNIVMLIYMISFLLGMIDNDGVK
jgi:hypothetical protein